MKIKLIPTHKINATAVKKCLNKIFGFVIPCRNCWAEMYEAFPSEKECELSEKKQFLRRYVWKYCHERVGNRFKNPYQTYNKWAGVFQNKRLQKMLINCAKPTN